MRCILVIWYSAISKKRKKTPYRQQKRDLPFLDMVPYIRVLFKFTKFNDDQTEMLIKIMQVTRHKTSQEYSMYLIWACEAFGNTWMCNSLRCLGASRFWTEFSSANIDDEKWIFPTIKKIPRKMEWATTNSSKSSSPSVESDDVYLVGLECHCV